MDHSWKLVRIVERIFALFEICFFYFTAFSSIEINLLSFIDICSF